MKNISIGRLGFKYQNTNTDSKYWLRQKYVVFKQECLRITDKSYMLLTSFTYKALDL